MKGRMKTNAPAPPSGVQVGALGSGTALRRLLNAGMNVNALRTPGTLRHEEWKELDEAIIKAARERLRIVAALRSRGLTHNLNNGLGTTIFEYEDVSDMRDAEVTMDAVSRVNNDTIEYDLKGLPMPVTHKDYQLGIRKLHASRQRGEGIDTTQAEIASRKVAEAAEYMVMNGWGDFQYGQQRLYGLTNTPLRNTVTMAVDWTEATGRQIHQDVLACKQALINARHFGPYAIYLPTNFEIVMDDDYKEATDRGLRERLMAIAGVASIEVADYLAPSNVVMVELSKETIRLVEGLALNNVEWESEGGMMFHFKIMQILIPQIRADQYGRCGVAHLASVES